uniref:Uncharacterized protein n=1 Tax=Knipowitschia caucasica TaxID=637954 RepID=A0AAV2KNE5_KNICA
MSGRLCQASHREDHSRCICPRTSIRSSFWRSLDNHVVTKSEERPHHRCKKRSSCSSLPPPPPPLQPGDCVVAAAPDPGPLQAFEHLCAGVGEREVEPRGGQATGPGRRELVPREKRCVCGCEQEGAVPPGQTGREGVRRGEEGGGGGGVRRGGGGLRR